MKHKQIDIDVDFIGGERPLTREDEIAFSEYLKAKKLLREKKTLHKTSFRLRKKVAA